MPAVDPPTLVLDDLDDAEVVIRGAATGTIPASFQSAIDAEDADLGNARLRDMKLTDVHWRSTRVRDSDLTGVRWDGARLVGVVFENCDLTGMQVLGRSHLSDVTFTNCKLSYTNWFDVVFDQVTFLDCRIREARFASLRLRAVRMHRSDGHGSSFDRVTLEASGDLDLRGSSIDDTTGLAEIRGLRVDTTQAAAIGAGLLAAAGITVDDDHELS